MNNPQIIRVVLDTQYIYIYCMYLGIWNVYLGMYLEKIILGEQCHILTSSGVATGGMGGSGPPTFIQTFPEISANPLKSFFIYKGDPMYIYCNFYCSLAKKNGSDPHFFWAGDATAHLIIWERVQI